MIRLCLAWEVKCWSEKGLDPFRGMDYVPPSLFSELNSNFLTGSFPC